MNLSHHSHLLKHLLQTSLMLNHTGWSNKSVSERNLNNSSTIHFTNKLLKQNVFKMVGNFIFCQLLLIFYNICYFNGPQRESCFFMKLSFLVTLGSALNGEMGLWLLCSAFKAVLRGFLFNSEPFLIIFWLFKQHTKHF